MAKRVFISIGSNLGDRAENCRGAVRRIVATGEARVVRESSLYETEPWGVAEQGPFVNSVIEVETELSPGELFRLLKGVEREMGRTPAPRWGERLIDLDILFYGEDVVMEEGLRIPHPRLHERVFVLAPLAEIAPALVHPVFKKTAGEMLAGLKAPGWIRRL